MLDVTEFGTCWPMTAAVVILTICQRVNFQKFLSASETALPEVPWNDRFTLYKLSFQNEKCLIW